jgi:NADH-quinone oxidoreductase subunit H
MGDLLILLVKVVGVFAALMLTVIVLIWAERRVVSFMQTRMGPNRVGPFGAFQSIADAIKLFFKEDVIPTRADKALFVLAPLVLMIPAFLAFSVIPFGDRFGSQLAQLTDLDIGLLWVLAMGSLQVYGIVLAGYAAGSNYPLLGGVRSSAQMVSYEIAQGLSLVGVFMYAGTLSSRGLVEAQSGTGIRLSELAPWLSWLPDLPAWYIVPQFPLFVVFLLAGIAETNRAPFDLPEAESELVGGYHTEYSGIRFALLFLAEYLNVVTVSAVAVTAFLGGPAGPVFGFLPWLWPVLWFVLKVSVFLFIFVWLRATLPRLRYDILMSFGWKVLIPAALGWVVISAVLLVVDVSAYRQQMFVAAGLIVVVLLILSLVGGRRERQEPTPEGTRS